MLVDLLWCTSWLRKNRHLFPSRSITLLWNDSLEDYQQKSYAQIMGGVHEYWVCQLSSLWWICSPDHSSVYVTAEWCCWIIMQELIDFGSCSYISMPLRLTDESLAGSSLTCHLYFKSCTILCHQLEVTIQTSLTKPAIFLSSQSFWTTWLYSLEHCTQNHLSSAHTVSRSFILDGNTQKAHHMFDPKMHKIELAIEFHHNDSIVPEMHKVDFMLPTQDNTMNPTFPVVKAKSPKRPANDHENWDTDLYTCWHIALRVLIALAAFFDCKIHQIDIATVFLNGWLKHKIYMHAPNNINIRDGHLLRLINMAWNKARVSGMSDFVKNYWQWDLKFWAATLSYFYIPRHIYCSGYMLMTFCSSCCETSISMSMSLLNI